MRNDGAFWIDTRTVAVGTPQVIELADGRRAWSVSVAPEATGNATVEFTLAPQEDVLAGTAIWITLFTTIASAAKSDGKQIPARALRVTAATAACRVEVLQ